MYNKRLHIGGEAIYARGMIMPDSGLTHVYYGNGKGKTTCALGLALRASGCGLKVVIVQFLKDMETGELEQLSRIPNIKVIRGKATSTWVRNMTPSEVEETCRIHSDNLAEALRLIDAGECDMLVLDEVLDALRHGVLDEDLLRRVVFDRPNGIELVMTGHRPIGWIMDCADYITEMRKERHPYDEGTRARKGIEF